MALPWTLIRDVSLLLLAAAGIILIVMLAGCRSYHYQHGDVQFKTNSFLSEVTISGMSFAVDPETGLRSVTIESYDAQHAAVKALADLAKAGLEAAPTP